jgi:hypothetical protein
MFSECLFSFLKVKLLLPLAKNKKSETFACLFFFLAALQEFNGRAWQKRKRQGAKF